ncbi:uncharacterized protein LOC126819702 isoform X2 [Patella vulgata]|uniref:uncharacterized protein LOC126819702 isoform X2 n=1 Tax=Patella vulgata TaxID=6465 RepID=UPI00217FC7C3|nr:uncharacterized protein LOC126819702 isoform X2 [Patella vulgata]
MARFGDKPFAGSKKKEIPRKKAERYCNPIIGWDPIPYQDDFDISSWMKLQNEGCFKKRKPTDDDLYRHIPSGRCSQIDNVSMFENESLAERFRPKKSQQVDEDKLYKDSPEKVAGKSVETSKDKRCEPPKQKYRQCKSAHPSVTIDQSATVNCATVQKPALNKQELKSTEHLQSTEHKNVTVNKKDKVDDEDEDVNDDGYGSKISGTDDADTGTDITPVPLLDLVGVAEEESHIERTPSSFKWVREKDNGVNNKITKLTFGQSDHPVNTAVNRNDIINSSRAFVTDYIKRCQPQSSTKSNISTDQRPKSLVLSRVGIQDSNSTDLSVADGNASGGISNRSSSVIAKTNPELNVSNLVTESLPNRTSSRQTVSRPGNRTGSHRNVDSRRGSVVDHERQSVPFFPMTDLLPAVDLNIHTKQQERYAKHSVEDYYGRIGCGNPEEYADMSGIEALSQALDKHIGPPAFRPHYLRSPLQRAREQSNKRVLGQLTHLADGSETYRICTPRFYVDRPLNRRSGSADRVLGPVVSGPFKKPL